MNVKSIRFINSFHTISLSVMAITSLSYFVMHKLNYVAPQINPWWLGLSFFALGVLIHSLHSLNACGELKELSNSESDRISSSITLRSKMIRNSILFYFIFVSALGVLIWTGFNTNLALSLLVALISTLLLSLWGAFNDYIEFSEFKRTIQARANKITEQERIRKKIKEASK
ncbi:TPA: hypothetical protein NU789_001728 [Acinetobacter baumannii]|uniref:hypothetical protein n=1 Tax=Acinetobacter calcoaceticus/baumannii complex TaxID=909768 RepID=UPI00046DB18A|nr:MULTISPECIES: hypothetical protein [Acinetobacter calcoaceticus/baumannii complex]HAI54612.1 hypothetical protein [Acinetobacter nosocomialis]EKV9553967.1 hypothetical protein [Acinetobacter baumannii]KQK46011.1 hypothetical protein AQ482_11185 [Acinetobacter baumannii]MCG6641514.1 hypothetical protein [Acinetobacter baumannii]MCQ1048830.1 hypothetical protein [Acinetobacter baumannii]